MEPREFEEELDGIDLEDCEDIEKALSESDVVDGDLPLDEEFFDDEAEDLMEDDE